MRYLFVIPLILFNILLIGQDSTWIKADIIAFQEADGQPSFRAATDYMEDYLGPRRLNGPITQELTRNYRKTAFWLMLDGNYPKAYAYIDTTLQLQKITPNLPLINRARAEYTCGEILNEQGILGASQYWHERALITIKEVIAQGDKSPDRQNRVQYYTNQLAFLAAQNQNFAKADILNISFNTLYQSHGDKLDETDAALNALGNIMARGFNLQKQELFVEARQVYEEAFNDRFFNKKQCYQDLLITRGNHANTYNEVGDYQAAEPLVRDLLQEMLSLASNNPQFWDRTIITYGYLLNALQGQGKYAEMLPIYNDAIALRYKIDSTEKGRNLGLINTFMAEAANKQGDYPTAAEYFAKARYNFVGDATPLGAAKLPRIKGNLIYGQEEFLYFLQAYREAFVREADGGNDQALDHALATARSIDSLLQRGVAQLSLTASVGGFLRLENRHYQRGIDLALRLYRERGEQQFLTEAFSFASVQKANLLRRYLGAQELALSYGVPQAIIGEKVRLETNVLVLEQALTDASEERKNELRQQLLKEQQALAEIQRELNQDYPTFSQAMRGASLADPLDAARDLEENQQIIEYFLGPDSIYLFSLSASDGLGYAVVPRPENLENLITNAFLETDANEQLYQLLIAPITLPNERITRLQFIPDGVLWNVPFAALKTKGEYLIQRQAVSYAYSSAVLFAANDTDYGNAGYLGYGISYDDLIKRINSSGNRSGTDNQLRNMGSLPYARREVEEVALIFDVPPILDSQVTKAHFFRSAPSAGILHLAMHGILEENPMESALVFEAEETAAYDLLKMHELLGKQFPTRLTILSACHSGNGPLEVAEGRQSIGRAFAAAGSKATITSKWAAPDRATYTILKSTIMQVNSGAPTDVALQRGILHYLEESSTTEGHPTNWAHLSLTGSVSPVYPQSFWKWYLLAFCSLTTIAGLLFLYSKIKSNRRSNNNS